MIGSAFWSGAEANCVVVEADAFKETDVVYRALSSHHHDMLQTAELVLSLINSHTHSYIKEPSAYKFYLCSHMYFLSRSQYSETLTNLLKNRCTNRLLMQHHHSLWLH